MNARIVVGALALLVTLPTLAATPLACSDCTAEGDESLGYFPPATEVVSGGTITWSASDVTHVQEDFGRSDHCLGVISQPGTPGSATFTISNGALKVSSELGANLTCDNAVKLPTGDFALSYYCSLHPAMRGVIVVTPEP